MWLYIIICVLIANWIWDLTIDLLNKKQSRSPLPAEVSDIYNKEEYERSQAYGRANTNVTLLFNSVNLLLLLAAFIFGGFAWFDNLIVSIAWEKLSFIPFADFFIRYEIFHGLLFYSGILAASLLINLPFSIYKTFVIEEKFGFNKMTLATFLRDRLIGLILLAIIGIPLVTAVLFIFSFAVHEPLSWLCVWLLFIGFQLIILYVAPTWVMPLFNKFEPLEDGELKQAIEDFASQENFVLNGIYKMNGSKRSSKANAYFTGFGKNRRIVLFDTLIEKHSTEELVAILAHEVGHYKKKHIFQQLALSAVTTALTLYIFQVLLLQENLLEAFQFNHSSIYASLFFCTFIIIPLDQIFGIINNLISRKNEYEADAYSAEKYGQPSKLISALKTLSRSNLSNLNPHPLKVFTEYSHPPLKDRIKALKKRSSES